MRRTMTPVGSTAPTLLTCASSSTIGSIDSIGRRPRGGLIDGSNERRRSMTSTCISIGSESYRKVQSAESAYMMQHMTKPQTIGIALSDSPLGFAAWVLEKFHRWGDTHGNIESRFSKDDLITNIL